VYAASTMQIQNQIAHILWELSHRHFHKDGDFSLKGCGHLLHKNLSIACPYVLTLPLDPVDYASIILSIIGSLFW